MKRNSWDELLSLVSTKRNFFKFAFAYNDDIIDSKIALSEPLVCGSVSNTTNFSL